MKKIIGAIILFLVTVLMIPSAVLTAAFGLPSMYDESYYGELPAMVEKLSTSEKKKIIFIGGSSVAFGLNLPLLEGCFPDYEICPFGLYGAIGTKAMMDIAIDYVGEGDVVILSPEINEQTMSLYFSGIDYLRGIDGHFSLLSCVKSENASAISGNLLTFAADKWQYNRDGKPQAEGVYAKSSFNQDCAMIYERPYNQMPLLYDDTCLIDYSVSLIQTDFVDYVNEYYKTCWDRGALMVYGFPPVNALAVTENATTDEFYSELSEKLLCPLLGDPQSYILDYDWFYDSNFHMNSSGTIVYSAQLIKDIKIILDDSSETIVELPSKPVIPSDTSDAENYELTADFLFETYGSGVKIVGLTEEAKLKTRIEFPTSYDGKMVIYFEPTVLQENTTVEEVVIPANITHISDYSFAGCTNLNSICLQSEVPNCTVGQHLLDDTDAMLKVSSQKILGLYSVDYYWSQYASRFCTD